MNTISNRPEGVGVFKPEYREKKERRVVTMTMDEVLENARANTPLWQMIAATTIESFKEDWNEDLTPEQVIENMEKLFTAKERKNTQEVLLIEGKEIVGYVDIILTTVEELNDAPNEQDEEANEENEVGSLQKKIREELREMGLKDDDIIADVSEAAVIRKFRGKATNLLELYQGAINEAGLKEADYIYFWTRAAGRMTKMYGILERLGVKEFLRLNDENQTVFYCISKQQMTDKVAKTIESYFKKNT